MSESTSFLPPELADLGLMALADPAFAERLVEALRGLPPLPTRATGADVESPAADVAVAANAHA
jgi:hypothetical protein